MSFFRVGLLFTVVLSAVSFGAVHVMSQDNPPDPFFVPDPVSPIDEGANDIINFLLVGSATSNPGNPGLTDVILIVSINRTAGSVSLISIPRDLYIYIPEWQMQKINTAYLYGETNAVEGGGATLLADAITYNLGLEIDYFARVDFAGFRRIIDAVDGIEVSVDCAIQDWRLREPWLDQMIEENWDLFTLPVGLHEMDGDLALWYVRSRRTSSDFDRGRRQQDVARALWRKISDLGLINQLPGIWGQVTTLTDTDIGLPDMAGFVPLALSLDTNKIASYTFHLNEHVTITHSIDGAEILLPMREPITSLLQQTTLAPTEQQIFRGRGSVDIMNASGIPGLDRVAADRLALEGFATRIVENEFDSNQNASVIYDFVGQSKGSGTEALQTTLRISEERVVIQPEADRRADYEVVIGRSYASNSCTRDVLPPVQVSSE